MLQISGEAIGEVKTVSSMHQRKAEMAKHADAFIALPGGYGTVEEFLEMISWSQLGIHDKPMDIILACLPYLIEESASHNLIIANTAEERVKKMEECAPVRNKVERRKS